MHFEISDKTFLLMLSQNGEHCHLKIIFDNMKVFIAKNICDKFQVKFLNTQFLTWTTPWTKKAW